MSDHCEFHILYSTLPSATDAPTSEQDIQLSMFTRGRFFFPRRSSFHTDGASSRQPPGTIHTRATVPSKTARKLSFPLPFLHQLRIASDDHFPTISANFEGDKMRVSRAVV